MPTGFATPIPPQALVPEAAARLRRLRALAWFLDRSISIGKWRVGFDPLIGLIPGVGDWVGAMLSFYVLYEGARLGLPISVLTRMAGNILVEAVIGAVPILGDLFDFAWQANTRNLALVEGHYHADFSTRPLRRIGFALAVFFLALLAFFVGLFFVLFKLVEMLFA
ncbi:MAG: DUF4112 domain-containing protein [Verrucomicrobiota bacterium]